MKSFSFKDSENTAFVYNTKDYSFRLINDKADSISRTLVELGISKADRVGIFLGNCPLFVSSVLAVSKLGASNILLSNKFKKNELESILRDVQTHILITSLTEISDVEGLNFQKQILFEHHDQDFGWIYIWEIQSSAHRAVVNIPEDDNEKEFTIQFTSGVSGKSKIVPRTYNQVFSEIENYIKTVTVSKRDVFICPAPLFHAYGLINGFFVPYYAGCTSIIMNTFVPGDFISYSLRYKPTIAVCVPIMYSLLCQTYLEKPVDLTFFRICFSAGAKLSEDIAAKFNEKFNIKINQQYGSTETGTMCVNLYDSNAGSNSVGKPLQHSVVKIIDENNEIVGLGQSGEIIIKSNSNMSGYLNEDNSQKFINGYYRTSDIGHLDKDNNLNITGRKSRFINVAGLKVDPFEIEAFLSKHEAIQECAIIGIPDELSGELIKAFIKVKREISVTEIRNYCKNSIADYKIPRIIEFVDSLPKSPTGKVLIKYLITR